MVRQEAPERHLSERGLLWEKDRGRVLRGRLEPKSWSTPSCQQGLGEWEVPGLALRGLSAEGHRGQVFGKENGAWLMEQAGVNAGLRCMHAGVAGFQSVRFQRARGGLACPQPGLLWPQPPGKMVFLGGHAHYLVWGWEWRDMHQIR